MSAGGSSSSAELWLVDQARSHDSSCTVMMPGAVKAVKARMRTFRGINWTHVGTDVCSCCCVGHRGTTYMELA